MRQQLLSVGLCPSFPVSLFHNLLCMCSVAVGALYPAYATYKTVVVPKRGGPTATNTTSASPQSRGSVHSVQGERWLKYWALFGLTVVAERLLDGHLDR